MKRLRKACQVQIELFCERRFVSDQVLRELPPDRQAELKKRIAELLLNVTIVDAAEVPRGGDHDA
jgi:hypothetical protein